jgi:uncharacterized membrane protein YebE (DUF533 family)
MPTARPANKRTAPQSASARRKIVSKRKEPTMFDPERLLGQMLGGALGEAFGGQRGRRKRNSAFGTGNLGGKAQLGLGLLGIAMAAFEHYGQQNRSGSVSCTTANPGAPPPPPPSGAASVPPPPPPATVKTRALPVLDEHQQQLVLLIRTMIAAANADGHIDAAERDTLLARARDGGLDEETLAWLEAEIAKPQTLGQVIANARAELAAETYAAAALAITVDTEAERRWLDALAHGLKLEPAVRADLDARIAAA